MTTHKVIIYKEEWYPVLVIVESKITNLDVGCELNDLELEYVNKSFVDFKKCQDFLKKKCAQYDEDERYK